MEKTRPICLLSTVVGALLAGCAPGLDDPDRVAAAAEVATADGDKEALVGAFCDWLEDFPGCADLDVGGIFTEPAEGWFMGRYRGGEPAWSDDAGVAYGRFHGFDGQASGRFDWRWATASDQGDGNFEGSSFGQEQAWLGEMMGEYWTAEPGEGGIHGVWALDGMQATRELAATWRASAQGDGGRFVGIYRAPPSQEPTVHKLRIRNEIDGRSSMVIGTYYAWYEHHDYAAPGMHFYFGEGDPASMAARPTFVQGSEWYPTWPEDGENRDCGCVSSVFESQPPHEVLVPFADAEISLEVLEGRGEVSIVTYPSAANHYELTLEWDDNPQGGPAWYEVELTFLTD